VLTQNQIAEAGQGKFESRHGVPGHFQQGTVSIDVSFQGWDKLT
jgi:hypothetical protein